MTDGLFAHCGFDGEFMVTRVFSVVFPISGNLRSYLYSLAEALLLLL